MCINFSLSLSSFYVHKPSKVLSLCVALPLETNRGGVRECVFSIPSFLMMDLLFVGSQQRKRVRDFMLRLVTCLLLANFTF